MHHCATEYLDEFAVNFANISFGPKCSISLMYSSSIPVQTDFSFVDGPASAASQLLDNLPRLVGFSALMIYVFDDN